jgi:hypothetical protein
MPRENDQACVDGRRNDEGWKCRIVEALAFADVPTNAASS